MSGFNICVACFRAGFGVCVWNARALAHHNQVSRKHKLSELALLLKRFEAVIILEAHGSDDLFRQSLKLHLAPILLLSVSLLKATTEVMLGSFCY